MVYVTFNYFKCGDEGHMSRECPNPGSGGGGSRACFKVKENLMLSLNCDELTFPFFHSVVVRSTCRGSARLEVILVEVAAMMANVLRLL